MRPKLHTSCLLGSRLPVYECNAKVHYCRNNQYLQHMEQAQWSKPAKGVTLPVHKSVNWRRGGVEISNLDKQVIKLLQYKLPKWSACKQNYVR